MVDKNAGLTRISYLTCRVKEVQNRNVHVKMLNGLKKERLKFAATYWVPSAGVQATGGIIINTNNSIEGIVINTQDTITPSEGW